MGSRTAAQVSGTKEAKAQNDLEAESLKEEAELERSGERSSRVAWSISFVVRLLILYRCRVVFARPWHGLLQS